MYNITNNRVLSAANFPLKNLVVNLGYFSEVFKACGNAEFFRISLMAEWEIVMKKLICILLCLVILTVPLVSFASAPEFLGTTYSGNCSNLFDILNPDQFSTTTTISTCIVSAAAVSGTSVAIYLYDPSTQMYRKITTYFSGVRLEETTVGASGLYAQQVLLKSGLNKILVYAKKGSKIQTRRLEVTLVSEKFTGNIKSFVSGRFN